MALDLTLDECIRVNASLLKAVKSADHGAMKDILATLKVSDVRNKLKHLAESKLGQTVSKLCKYEHDDVKATASEVKKLWAARAAAAKAESGKVPSAKPEPMEDDPAPAPKAEAPAPAAPPAPEPESVKAEAEAAPVASSSAAGSSSGVESVKMERQESLSFVAWRPAAPTGDQTRDMVRAKLQEAFDKGKEANERFLREAETDTAAMAEEAETNMFVVNGESVSKEYKARFRSLQFNLKDPKNPHFIKAVITGQVHVTDLATMEVREMASEEMKNARQAAAEHAKMALMDDRTYKNYAGKKTEDGILKCPKCKSMKTEYVEVQTRSADEPTTKKCTCNACDYRWKFC